MAAETLVPGDQPDPALTTSVEELPAARVVHVAGEIDMSNVAEFESAIEQAESGAPERAVIVIDLRRVTFLGAESLRCLVASHDRIAETGRAMRVVAPPGSGVVRRLLDLSGVGALLDLFETVESALPPDKG